MSQSFSWNPYAVNFENLCSESTTQYSLSVKHERLDERLINEMSEGVDTTELNILLALAEQTMNMTNHDLTQALHQNFNDFELTYLDQLMHFFYTMLESEHTSESENMPPT